MGRLYLPPYVVALVGVLAAVGALLFLLAHQAAAPASEKPEPAPAVEPEGVVAVGPERVAVLASAQVPSVESAVPAEPEAAPPKAKPAGRLVLRPARGGELVLRVRPGGPVVARLGARTEFGSPTTVTVVARRGRWLGVVTTQVGNGRLGWVDPAESAVRKSRVRVNLVLDLSARRLVVRRGDRVLRRMTVGVGRPTSPTPTGRFAVTDKIPGSRYGAYYGCCILALSAHQPNLPQGWRGGDRIAVHGTNDPSSIGAASSAGCPHAGEEDMRFLMRVVPLGAPIVVRD